MTDVAVGATRGVRGLRTGPCSEVFRDSTFSEVVRTWGSLLLLS